MLWAFFFFLGFPGGSDGKASAYNMGDLGLIPGLGRSPGEGNGNPLQCSCLGSPMDRGAWGVTIHGITKSGTQLSYWTLPLTLRLAGKTWPSSLEPVHSSPYSWLWPVFLLLCHVFSRPLLSCFYLLIPKMSRDLAWPSSCQKTDFGCPHCPLCIAHIAFWELDCVVVHRSQSNLFFNWRITALQRCVGFCQTRIQISHRHTNQP